MADITYGSAQEFGTTNSSVLYCQCCEIDTNKFVVVWRDTGDADKGKARVGTVSGTTITWGAISEFCADIATSLGIGVCKLDTDKFVVVYADNTDDDGWARVGTVSTRTISWGTAKEFHDTDVEYPSCCQLETDKFAIAYNDETGGDLGTVCICTVANSTITSGTPVDFEGQIRNVRCCKLDTDKFVAFYSDSGDGTHPKACAFSISGTTPTPGTIKEIDAIAAYFEDCCQLDTDKFVIAWYDSVGVTGEIEICTVSGTTITEGAQVEFSDARPDSIGLAKIDGTHLVIVYEDLGNSEYGTSRFCSFSGTTITLGNEEIFSAAQITETDVCLISANKVAVVYKDDADANDIGEAIIGDKAGEDHTKSLSDSVAISDTIAKTFGVAKSESVAVAESSGLEAKFARSLSDSVAVADTIVKAPSLFKVDSVAIAESITAKAIGVFKTETVAVADTFSRAVVFYKSLADSVSIAESISKAVSIVKADSMVITESIVKAIGIVRTETIAIAETTAKAIQVAKADTVAVAEVISKAVSIVKADTFAITDSTAKAFGMFRTETIVVAEEITLIFKTISLTLKDRTFAFTLKARSFAFTLKDRIFSFTLRER